ncbi:substrate-binding domain-containing protein [Paenibacillus sp. FSL H8-0537]|uniref:sugar ABC transporter substrate-binding protein n=1 Tax=Paenibacillus sp. FSL H8-0537 TaxID=2921399 RepID=UPI003100F242
MQALAALFFHRRAALRRRALLAALLTALLVLTLLMTGCTNDEAAEDIRSVSSSNWDSGSPSSTPFASTASTASTAAPDIATFGIIYPMAHPYYETVTESAKAAAALRGVQLIVKAPDEANLEQQIRMMETMIASQVDGIALDPIDAEALVPVINKAVQAGITVICFESDSPSSKRAAFIGTDHAAAGAQMGHMLSELLGGRGMVIVENGMTRMKSLSERLEGMLTYINEQTDIQVLEVQYNEGNETRALAQLEKMIDDHPHFDALVSMDALSGSASVLVWKAQGLNRYSLTFGMMPEIQEAIHNGQITASLSQNEQLWGTRIIERLLQAFAGETLPLFDDTGTLEITQEDIPLLNAP